MRPLTAALQFVPDPARPTLPRAQRISRTRCTCSRSRRPGSVFAPPVRCLCRKPPRRCRTLPVRRVADDVERLEARRTELAALMAGVPSTIQSAPNGPYLVANVATMTDWLGVSLAPTPQVALCRCGASTIKPWCDGSHAQIGFEDAKSEDRVPDRLDRYHGIGVEIADNRGTCAHSGFCTDRLPTVFRTDTEPFVAPAGGRVDEILRAARDCPSGALSATTEAGDPVGRSDSERKPAIEVSKDGPYRVDRCGRAARSRRTTRSAQRRGLARALQPVPLRQVPEQAVLQRHALVRRLPRPPAPDQATLFQWAGGFPALLRLTRRFYEVHVPEDPLLSGLFSQMSPDHPQRVAAWLGQVFGGPPAYSERYGEYDRMISQHLDKALTPEQRARWVTAARSQRRRRRAPRRRRVPRRVHRLPRVGLADRARELPARRPPTTAHARAPLVVGVRRLPLVATARHPRRRAGRTPPELPDADQPLSYEAHIKPLFRERDRDSMRFAFDLWSHDDVSAHADAILARLQSGNDAVRRRLATRARRSVRTLGICRQPGVTRRPATTQGGSMTTEPTPPTPDRTLARKSE